jgi:hypothetical protein
MTKERRSKSLVEAGKRKSIKKVGILSFEPFFKPVFEGVALRYGKTSDA